MSIIERKPAQPNQSIIDSLTMLQAVVGSDGPAGCTQLAREYGLDVTRVNRILGTLAYLGVLKRTRSRKYVPGPGVHVLAAMSLGNSALPNCAVPHVRALERKTKMHASIGLLWRTRLTFLHYGGLPHTSPGLHAAHEAATGRVLLAQYPDEEIRRQYSEYSGNSSVDIRGLLSILKRVRANGYAMGMNSNAVAVAIGDPGFAALGLQPRGKEPTPIRKKDLPLLAEQLHEVADAIAKEMASRRAS